MQPLPNVIPRVKGKLWIQWETSDIHLETPWLPSHQRTVICILSITHCPRSCLSVITQTPLPLHFIQPWLWHSKSLKIFPGPWQAFYLKSSQDNRLISQLSANGELSFSCTDLKVPVSWRCLSCLWQISQITWQAKLLQEIKGGFCSIYRTIWASFGARVTPVYSLNENGL